jgi:hypothetical protein
MIQSLYGFFMIMAIMDYIEILLPLSGVEKKDWTDQSFYT